MPPSTGPFLCALLRATALSSVGQVAWLASIANLPVPPALARIARVTAVWGRIRLGHPRTPLWLLGGVSAASLAARTFNLDKPYDADKHRGSLIFDEQYYVNAARVILGIRPPAGANYAGAVLYHDPNAEHPPLGKLIVSDTIRVFGDNPLGWRIGPVVFGTLAILAMYWLVRSARGSAWLALGAATLMAADNLMMVHGRIATLDIFLVTFMLIAVGAYLRGKFLLAGIALAFGMATKLLAIDVVFVVALFELGLLVRRHPDEVRSRTAALRSRLFPVLTVSGIGLLGYVALLTILDAVVAPIGGPGTCRTVANGFHDPLLHSNFMLCYAGKLTSPNGPEGIASYPWQWLINEKPIDYFTLATNIFRGGKQVSTHVVVGFTGEMNPAIILLAFPALGLAIRTWWRERDQCSLLTLAWFFGTFIPFALAAAPLGPYGRRTSYLYYMVAVLPAVYVGVAQLFSRRWLPPAALGGYAVTVAFYVASLYPIRTWSGR